MSLLYLLAPPESDLASVLIAHTDAKMLGPGLVISRLDALEFLHQADNVVASLDQRVLLT